MSPAIICADWKNGRPPITSCWHASCQVANAFALTGYPPWLRNHHDPSVWKKQRNIQWVGFRENLQGNPIFIYISFKQIEDFQGKSKPETIDFPNNCEFFPVIFPVNQSNQTCRMSCLGYVHVQASDAVFSEAPCFPRQVDQLLWSFAMIWHFHPIARIYGKMMCPCMKKKTN